MVFRVALAAVAALAVVAGVVGVSEDGKALARGWGDNVEWRPWSSAIEEATAMEKPILLIVHQPWCGACKSLKPKVAASKQVEDLSHNFVMVNAEGEEAPSDAKYAPDGGYFPRIVFMDSAGNPEPSITNVNGNPKYKYYYMSGKEVAESMQSAIAHFKSKADL